jgi:hypothetical protein
MNIWAFLSLFASMLKQIKEHTDASSETSVLAGGVQLKESGFEKNEG